MSMMLHRNKKRKKEREISHEGLNHGENFPFSDTDIEFEERPEEKLYTKTDINRMTIAELQELAANIGIENAHEKSGEKLKKALIEYFNL